MPPFIVTPPPGKPKGWDLADAESEGWTGETVRAWVAQSKKLPPVTDETRPTYTTHEKTIEQEKTNQAAAASPETTAQRAEVHSSRRDGNHNPVGDMGWQRGGNNPERVGNHTDVLTPILHNQDYIPSEAEIPPEPNRVEIPDDYTPEPPPSTPISPADMPPFRFLGHDSGTFFYLPDNARQVIDLSASDHKHLQLLQLAPCSWWERIFAGKDGVDWKAAANMLIQTSFNEGVFNPRRIRGRGCWIDGDDIVLHVGDRLIVNGAPKSLTERQSKFIYEQRQPLEHADVGALPVSESARLAELCDLMPFRESIHSMFLMGWCVVAPVCGVLSWRPHIWVSGKSGSGKSWVFTNVINPLVGKAALEVQSATTEAGIRQQLRSDALPIAFDEAESEDKQGQFRMQKVLELARQASSETGAGIIKGTAGGRAMEFNIRSCFCFSSIGIAAVQRADTSRVTCLELVKRENGLDRFEELKAVWAQTLGRPGYADGIRARALSLAKVIRANSKTLARAIAAKLGDQRLGDQMGALLAGAFAMMTDREFTPEEAAKRIEGLDWTPYQPNQVDTDESQALNTLLDAHIRLDDGRGGSTSTIGELIAAVVNVDASEEFRHLARATLLRHGVKVEDETVAVSNSHHALRRIFDQTPWAGKWKDQLSRTPGAEAVATLRLGAARHRAVRIPTNSLLAASNSDGS